MGKKSAPDPPDYGPVAESSEKAAELAFQTSQDQLAWAKEQWASQEKVLKQILDTQLPMMDENWQLAKEDRERYEELYLPMEERYLKRAEDWDTPERRAQEAAKAQTDVSTQFEAQRQNALQRLESYGVDPSQTRSSALDLGVRMEQAKAMAQAGNQARSQIEKEGMGMLGESINVGRGMASQGLNYAGQSLAAGQGGQSSAAGWQGAAGAMGSPTAWAGLGQQGLANSASIRNMGFQNQMAAKQFNIDNSPWNTVAAMAGTAAGAAGYADGGEVRAAPPQRQALPTGGDQGGYVIPESVVRRKGTDYFDSMIKKGAEDERKANRQNGVNRHAMALPPPGALS